MVLITEGRTNSAKTQNYLQSQPVKFYTDNKIISFKITWSTFLDGFNGWASHKN